MQFKPTGRFPVQDAVGHVQAHSCQETPSFRALQNHPAHSHLRMRHHIKGESFRRGSMTTARQGCRRLRHWPTWPCCFRMGHLAKCSGTSGEFLFVHILHLHTSLLTIELPVALWSVGAINEEKGPCKHHLYRILMGSIVLIFCFSSERVILCAKNIRKQLKMTASESEVSQKEHI